MSTSRFDYDEDHHDVVVLTDSEGRPACNGWIIVGDHAVWLDLQADGSLKIETCAVSAETVLLGSLTVSHTAVMAVSRDNLQQISDGRALAPLVDDLTRLGFGTNKEINGADCVDTVNRHFSCLRISAS